MSFLAIRELRSATDEIYAKFFHLDKKCRSFGDGIYVEHEPTIQKQTNDFLTKEQLKNRLNLPSTRMVDEMMKRRMIPFQKLGHRTVRFNWEKVKAALEKFEHKAVGQK